MKIAEEVANKLRSPRQCRVLSLFSMMNALSNNTAALCPFNKTELRTAILAAQGKLPEATSSTASPTKLTIPLQPTQQVYTTTTMKKHIPSPSTTSQALDPNMILMPYEKKTPNKTPHPTEIHEDEFEDKYFSSYHMMLMNKEYLKPKIKTTAAVPTVPSTITSPPAFSAVAFGNQDYAYMAKPVVKVKSKKQPGPTHNNPSEPHRPLAPKRPFRKKPSSYNKGNSGSQESGQVANSDSESVETEETENDAKSSSEEGSIETSNESHGENFPPKNWGPPPQPPIKNSFRPTQKTPFTQFRPKNPDPGTPFRSTINTPTMSAPSPTPSKEYVPGSGPDENSLYPSFKPSKFQQNSVVSIQTDDQYRPHDKKFNGLSKTRFSNGPRPDPNKKNSPGPPPHHTFPNGPRPNQKGKFPQGPPPHPPFSNGPRPDTYYNGPRPDTFYNGPRPDTSYNGPRPSTFYNGPGPDTSYNGPRPDTSYNGPRPGTFYNGPGPDTSYNGPRPDTSYNGPGPDTSYNGPRPDTSYNKHRPDTSYNGPPPSSNNNFPRPTPNAQLLESIFKFTQKIKNIKPPFRNPTKSEGPEKPPQPFNQPDNNLRYTPESSEEENPPPFKPYYEPTRMPPGSYQNQQNPPYRPSQTSYFINSLFRRPQQKRYEEYSDKEVKSEENTVESGGVLGNKWRSVSQWFQSTITPSKSPLTHRPIRHSNEISNDLRDEVSDETEEAESEEPGSDSKSEEPVSEETEQSEETKWRPRPPPRRQPEPIYEKKKPSPIYVRESLPDPKNHNMYIESDSEDHEFDEYDEPSEESNENPQKKKTPVKKTKRVPAYNPLDDEEHLIDHTDILTEYSDVATNFANQNRVVDYDRYLSGLPVHWKEVIARQHEKKKAQEKQSEEEDDFNSDNSDFYEHGMSKNAVKVHHLGPVTLGAPWGQKGKKKYWQERSSHYY